MQIIKLAVLMPVLLVYWTMKLLYFGLFFLSVVTEIGTEETENRKEWLLQLLKLPIKNDCHVFPYFLEDQEVQIALDSWCDIRKRPKRGIYFQNDRLNSTYFAGVDIKFLVALVKEYSLEHVVLVISEDLSKSLFVVMRTLWRLGVQLRVVFMSSGFTRLATLKRSFTAVIVLADFNETYLHQVSHEGWLDFNTLWFVKYSSNNNNLNSLELTLSSNLNLMSVSDKDLIFIKEAYKVTPTSPLRMNHIGLWDKTSGLVTSDIHIWERRKNISDMMIRVVTDNVRRRTYHFYYFTLYFWYFFRRLHIRCIIRRPIHLQEF
jgi:hypothetical protein